jgi:hypothetical protein
MLLSPAGKSKRMIQPVIVDCHAPPQLPNEPQSARKNYTSSAINLFEKRLNQSTRQRISSLFVGISDMRPRYPPLLTSRAQRTLLERALTFELQPVSLPLTHMKTIASNKTANVKLRLIP